MPVSLTNSQCKVKTGIGMIECDHTDHTVADIRLRQYRHREAGDLL
jgi:hypothetical protein